MSEPPPSGDEVRERRWDLMAWTALLVMVVGLFSMGRVWWCQQGGLSPWTSQANGPHTSQHVLDPYSFTHVLHGMLFYALLWVLLGRRAGPRLRMSLAVCVEAGWELLENSTWVIDRYRQTLAEGYTGDSVLNSLGDVLCCTLGYLIARTLPWKVTLGLALLIELVLLLTIRDNLTLNVIMLAHPFPGVTAWQKGG